MPIDNDYINELMQHAKVAMQKDMELNYVFNNPYAAKKSAKTPAIADILSENKKLRRTHMETRLELQVVREELSRLKNSTITPEGLVLAINRVLRRRGAKLRLQPASKLSDFSAQLGEILWMLEKQNPDADPTLMV